MSERTQEEKPIIHNHIDVRKFVRATLSNREAVDPKIVCAAVELATSTYFIGQRIGRRDHHILTAVKEALKLGSTPQQIEVGRKMSADLSPMFTQGPIVDINPEEVSHALETARDRRHRRGNGATLSS